MASPPGSSEDQIQPPCPLDTTRTCSGRTRTGAQPVQEPASRMKLIGP